MPGLTRALTAAIATLAVLAPAADGATVGTASVNATGLGARAARLPTFPAPSNVRIVPEPCPLAISDGEPACVPDADTIYFAPWVWHPRLTLEHERFHIIDRRGDLTDAQRAEFMRLRGFGPLNGVPRTWRSGANSPHEQAAEAWAYCSMRREQRFRGKVVAGYDYAAPVRVHREICALFATVAVR